MEPKLLSSTENDFFRDYSKKIKSLQDLEDESKTGLKAATRIPIDYCVIYKLYSLPIIFHPISIEYTNRYEKLSWVKVSECFQKIIEYELSSKSPQLTTEELQLAIFHYRNTLTLIK